MVTLLRKPSYLIQDYTTIGSVGSVGQQMAGHRPAIMDPGHATSAETLALYYFGDNGGLITADEVGSFTLTNNGTIPQAAGIFGGSTGAASFNGSSQNFMQSTLLDSTPTSIVIDMWVYLTDGQPSATQCFFYKDNIVGSDSSYSYFGSTGALVWTTEQGNNGDKNLTCMTFPDGATGWYYLVFAWDTTNGKRFWSNGALVASDSTATTLMGSGVGSDFCIGNHASALSQPFNGKMAYFRVRNKVLDQHDVDVAYATKYLWSSLDIPLETALITPYVKEGGDNQLISQLNYGGMEATRYNGATYRYGGLFNSTDSLKLIGRE